MIQNCALFHILVQFIYIYLISYLFLWSQWEDKYKKSQGNRTALRQALKLFEQQLDKIQAENLSLKKGECNVVLFSYALQCIYHLSVLCVIFWLMLDAFSFHLNL